MAWRTILVQVSNPKRAESVLAVASGIAEHSNAHLVGLHISPAVVYMPPVPMPFGGEMLGSIQAHDDRESRALKAVFEQGTKGRSFVAEWRHLKPTQTDLGAAMMDHGHAADIIVTSQTDPDWDLSPVLDFPERLALESGRPVLLVPTAGKYGPVGKRVTVAWNGKRESSRAVFDSLPLLAKAELVTILCVGGRGAGMESGTLPGAEIAASLARHGIKVTVQKTTADDISVGDEILSRLSDHGADLLVMGAYGHARLHQLVFGGVTRHVTRHMTVPTLLSH